MEKGFSKKEGPFVKALDDALQSVGVHRQQYFGGAFVGNHVHQVLKVPNTYNHMNETSPTLFRNATFRSLQVSM